MVQPRYRQLADDLRADIAAGRHPVGGQLPPELELCATYGVSRHTVRDALRLLRDAGLVERRRGAGTTIIAATSAPTFVQPLGGVDELMQYAREARLRVRASGQRKLTTVESDRLKAPHGQIWLVVEGVRLAGAEPVALSRIYVAPAYVSVAAQVRDWDGAILELIARDFGVAARRIEQEIAAETLDAAQARLLLTDKGAAALHTLRRYYDDKDQIILGSDSTHPGARFVYAMNYRREG